MSTENENDDDGYFGLCPTCHKTDGYLNIGRSHWFMCKEHKTKWFAGENLFSSWLWETEEQQQAEYDKLGFGEYEEVEPYRPARPAISPCDCVEEDGPRNDEWLL